MGKWKREVSALLENAVKSSAQPLPISIPVVRGIWHQEKTSLPCWSTERALLSHAQLHSIASGGLFVCLPVFVLYFTFRNDKAFKQPIPGYSLNYPYIYALKSENNSLCLSQIPFNKRPTSPISEYLCSHLSTCKKVCLCRVKTSRKFLQRQDN